MAPGREDRCRELDSLLVADEVEDDRCALGACLRADVARVETGCVEGDMRARGESAAARALAQVDRDDPCGGQRVQDLHGDVAEAADADHDDRPFPA